MCTLYIKADKRLDYVSSKIAVYIHTYAWEDYFMLIVDYNSLAQYQKTQLNFEIKT